MSCYRDSQLQESKISITVDLVIVANFARRTNSQIQESRENYYYDSATKGKLKFASFKFRGKSQNQKFAKIETRGNYRIYII